MVQRELLDRPAGGAFWSSTTMRASAAARAAPQLGGIRRRGRGGGRCLCARPRGQAEARARPARHPAPDIDGFAVAERLSRAIRSCRSCSSRAATSSSYGPLIETSGAWLHLQVGALRRSAREAAGVTDESLRPSDDGADAAAGFALGTEHALRNARLTEQRNRALLDAIPDTILRYGRDGTYLDARLDADSPNSSPRKRSSAETSATSSRMSSLAPSSPASSARSQAEACR